MIIVKRFYYGKTEINILQWTEIGAVVELSEQEVGKSYSPFFVPHEKISIIWS